MSVKYQGGALTPHQIEALAAWMAQHRIKACPLCRNASFAWPYLGFVVPHPPGVVSPSAHVVPLVYVFCERCGHSLSFSAVQVKLPP